MGGMGKPVEIGILNYPEAQLAAVHGLTDIFLVANRFAAMRKLMAKPAFRVSHWRSAGNEQTVECVFDTFPEPHNSPAVLIVPPSLHNPISHEMAAPFAAWLLERHDDGAVLCSVCAGAFVLAETGLLAGRSATTHWTHAAELTRRFPDIQECVITNSDRHWLTALVWAAMLLETLVLGQGHAQVQTSIW
jgi:transcriptional regulator GlxA family with amidase domain